MTFLLVFSQIFFSNITMWAKKAHKYINEQGSDMGVIMMCETHASRDTLVQTKIDAAKDGGS